MRFGMFELDLHAAELRAVSVALLPAHILHRLTERLHSGPLVVVPFGVRNLLPQPFALVVLVGVLR